MGFRFRRRSSKRSLEVAVVTGAAGKLIITYRGSDDSRFRATGPKSHGKTPEAPKADQAS